MEIVDYVFIGTIVAIAALVYFFPEGFGKTVEGEEEEKGVVGSLMSTFLGR